MRKLIVLLLLTLLISCDNSITARFQTVDIKNILESSQDFSGKNIVVQGYVSEATKTPILSMYKLTDGTGSIWVQTNKYLPEENQQLYTKAKTDNIASFRENSFGLHLVEIERFDEF